MAIYRGAGGAGDAVNDSSSEASAAVIAADAALAAKIAAEAARDAAQLSETNADASEANAASSATSASSAASAAHTYANNASNSAVSAANSATNAASSSTSAGVSATNAANSSTSAAGSASAAAVSATSASNSATSAAASATNATTSATSASTSASSASSSASTATTQASNASTSATNAASSASTANSAATTATTQAGIATTQATNASNSASAAATSATNAANSASTATTQAGIATTQASNAATSATASANSATASAAARDAALAALDSFDDRYLGTKSSDPTLDNDGNALVAGALYFNTTTNAMKVYDGSLWLAAYASLSGALLSANNLSDLNNAATARTNLGLGTAATTNSTAYATAAQGTNADTAYADRMKWDGGATGLVAATGRTSLGVTATGADTTYAYRANNLSDLANATTARTNLGVAIGSDVQAWDADLDAIAALTGTTGLLKKTAANTWSLDTNTYLTTAVSSVTGTAPISSSGGTTPAISISQATTSTNGYVSSTDWNTFNNKQPALVSGTNIKTVNGTTLLGSGDLGTIGIAYGGTGATSANAGLNNLMSYTTTATAAGTTTLTSSSTYKQYFTGTTTQTIVMPDVTTLALGRSYEIVNNSTGTLTINSSGANLITTIPAGLSGVVTCIAITGATAASWHWEYASFDSITGTGACVFATSPTLVTPALGTPSSGILTNCTGLPNAGLVNSSVTINGTAISLGGSGTVTAAAPNALTISSPLSGTSYNGSSAVTIALALGYGDTQNPYASKTANYILAAPNGAAGVPTFRAMVAADVPTLNQNTTGSAGSVANALTVGTGLKLSSGTTYNGSSALTINAVGTTLNSQTAAYILAATDAGKLVSITTGGVTVNNSIMSAGDIVTIYNNSASSQTITQGTGVTLQWAGQTASTTGNRTLGLYGMATIVFLSASSAVITGAGLT